MPHCRFGRASRCSQRREAEVSALPKISICIPTYNGEAYLAEALECVSAQTFDDFDVVIVDDCSTDGTVAIAERYVATEPRARLVRNAVRAGSSGRNANRCIDESSGEWIKFLFQDDLMTPDCLEKMLAAADQRPLVMSAHDYVFAPDTSDEVRRFYESLPILGDELPGTFASPDEVCAAITRQPGMNFIGPISASFIHRDCFAKYGRFDTVITYYPDLELWMRVGTNAGIAIVPERLASFRVHEETTSGRIRRDPLGSFRQSLDWIYLLRRIDQAPEYRRLREFARCWDPPFEPAKTMRDWLIEVRWLASEARYRQRDRRLSEELDARCNRDPVFCDALREFEAAQPVWAKIKEFVKSRV
jgi:glycosyltransferase involved in cell wall biosynthesis